MAVMEAREVFSNLIETIGHTPMVRLQKFPSAPPPETPPPKVFAKLESFNPGGSAKDRPARKLIEKAFEEGKILPGATIVESSSGNMGIGLAQLCAYYDLKFICVVDPKTNPQNMRIIKAYGAEVDLVEEPDPATGEFLQARLQRVREIVERTPNSFWPNQYGNLHNARAHYRTTMTEIHEACGEIDYLFCATSTCGTIRGCAEYVRDHGLSTKVIAVDAKGSLIFSSQQGERLLPGMGAGLVPPLCPKNMVDDVVHVSDLDCIIGCRRLVNREAILVGASSGGVAAAMEHYRPRMSPGATCALVLADRGERYLETVFSDPWVEEHFGDVQHLWEQDSALTPEPELAWSV